MSTHTDVLTTVCVVGGGPSGMMLGFLLARAGIQVTVLEKHGDFLRDFRGDTVHPSTLELMHELGILTEFLQRPHDQVAEVGAKIGTEYIPVADFSLLKTYCRFMVFMPQWEFLNFLSDKAHEYDSFSLRMDTEVVDLIEEGNRIVGVRATGKDGDTLSVRADLVVACDGRASVVRQRAGLKVIDVGAPMDVLWMRLSRKPNDLAQTLGRINAGIFFIMLNRSDYWQCAFIIPKGTLDELKAEGLDSFKARIESIAPEMSDRVDEIKSWDQVKLLTVKVDRLEQWYRDGLLCIGDAAHAMSPVGGVGINLAIQDAVAASNHLQEPLKAGTCTTEDLRRVQKWRTYPTRMMQRVQVAIQNAVIQPTLSSTRPTTVPPVMRILQHVRAARALPANLMGMGFRPEHIRPIPSQPKEVTSTVAAP